MKYFTIMRADESTLKLFIKTNGRMAVPTEQIITMMTSLNIYFECQYLSQWVLDVKERTTASCLSKLWPQVGEIILNLERNSQTLVEAFSEFLTSFICWNCYEDLKHHFATSLSAFYHFRRCDISDCFFTIVLRWQVHISADRTRCTSANSASFIAS